MYYEEKIINGVLCFRHDPKGAWIAFTLEEMAKKWEQQKKDFYDKQLAVVRAAGMGYLL